MIYPAGKTPAQVRQDIHQSNLKAGDIGYIDGYVQAADSRAYAVFVREDGVIDLAPLHLIKALSCEDNDNNDVDLFEHHEQMPKELAAICDKWNAIYASDGLEYNQCAEWLAEVEAIGFTFEYGLDAEPFNLRKK